MGRRAAIQDEPEARCEVWLSTVGGAEGRRRPSGVPQEVSASVGPAGGKILDM